MRPPPEPPGGVVVRPEPDDGRRWWRHDVPEGTAAWCPATVCSDIKFPRQYTGPRVNHLTWFEVLAEAGGAVVPVQPEVSAESAVEQRDRLTGVLNRAIFESDRLGYVGLTQARYVADVLIEAGWRRSITPPTTGEEADR